jgi:hypothetical protein
LSFFTKFVDIGGSAQTISCLVFVLFVLYLSLSYFLTYSLATTFVPVPQVIVEPELTAKKKKKKKKKKVTSVFVFRYVCLSLRLSFFTKFGDIGGSAQTSRHFGCCTRNTICNHTSKST